MSCVDYDWGGGIIQKKQQLFNMHSKSIYFDWYCKKHKHTWNTFVRRIVLDEHGCNYCGYDKMIATKRKK